MPKLKTPDGAELDDAAVQQQFAEAMAAPEPDDPMAPAPERKETGDAGSARAADSTASDDRRTSRARTTSARPPARGRGRRGKTEPKTEPVEGIYLRPVSEFLQSMTIAAALAPLPPGPLGVRIRLQGALVNQHQAGLASAVDAAARNNAVIRRGVESLTMGSAGWVLPAVLAVAPFAMQSAALWRDPATEDLAQQAEAFQSAVREQLAMMGEEQNADAHSAA